MRDVRSVVWLVATAVLTFCLTAPAESQQCNDFDGCTTNDMCRDGECVGTPASGGSCDDFNECTVNDRCVSELGEVTCTGDPAPIGTECQGGCGTCQSLSPFPVPGVPLACVPKAGSAGQTCRPLFSDDLGPCYPARCMEFGVPGFMVAVCSPAPILCPDTDGNPCTDACNPQTGRCERIEKQCGYPDCTRCDAATGSCMAINEGRACDDFNECTSTTRCENGNCIAGVPTPGGATATPTTVGANTPTPTNTVQAATPTMPTGSSCPCDCNGDGTVAINEVITAVNIGQETLALGACPAADTNGNGTVAINEIILGVNAGLNGCPS